MDLDRAIQIAVSAHAGQIDKAGRAYILHPIRVMLRCIGETDQIVGILHDVLEDCPAWTVARLREEGLGEDVTAALVALTRAPGETYEAFITRCGGHEIARRVKLADLGDNLDPGRPAPEGLGARYERAVDRLAGSRSPSTASDHSSSSATVPRT